MIVKILAISDTHRRIENAVYLINTLKPDYVLHMGDVASDYEDLQTLFPHIKLIGVLGNNDFMKPNMDLPYERIVNIAGKRFFMCHGHTYGVKSGLTRLIYKARAIQVDAVLFGHTHNAYLSDVGSLLVLNPGSSATYGYITIVDEKIYAKINRLR